MRIAEQAHSRADIHPRMGDKNPVWLQEARELCRTSGIKIVGWGPDMLTVEAKSEERAREIASQLGELGFKAIRNEDDAYAGWLNLSKSIVLSLFVWPSHLLGVAIRVVGEKYGARRGFLTLMTNTSGNILNAVGHAGHSDIGTTARHHTKPQVDKIRESLRTIEDMIATVSNVSSNLSQGTK